MAQGLSIVSQSSVSASQGGVSVISKDGSVQTFGTSVVSQNNLYVSVCDQSLNPLAAQIDITGGSDVDGVYSGFDEYPFTTGSFIDINIEASAIGYINNDVTVNLNEFGYVFVKIELVPDTVLFTCTTLFKNRFGITINKPLLDGYVEVKFQGSAAFSKDDYFTTFEAIKQGGSKYASIVLSDELEIEETDALTFKVAVVQEAGDYCYLSNISKKLC